MKFTKIGTIRNRFTRYIKFFLFALIFFYIIFTLLFIAKFTRIEQEKTYNHRNDESNFSICDLPVSMNPHDPLIKDFIQILNRTIICEKSDDSTFNSLDNLHQPLSYMNDFDPIIRLWRIKKHNESLKCMYQPFDRYADDDDIIQLLEKKPIIGYKLDLEKIGLEFVKIECYLSGKLVYSNIHSWPSRVPSHYITSFNDSNHLLVTDYPRKADEKISVMFLVIESLLNFERFMSKTMEALSNLSNNFVLRGLNKIADNSLPNMMPILSGYRPYYGEWPFDFEVDKGPYDDVDFIWSDFQKQGYATGYIEDDPYLGLFNHLSSGFKKPPTDWYPRPYWLMMETDQSDQNETFCYKQKPKIIYWLQQIKQFLNKVNKTKQPFFLWSFYIQVTHDDFNNAQLIDQYIADFINSYHHILENTVFVIMGDHGNRYGPLASTEYGQIESRMPLFNIHVPPQLLQRNQHLAHYLEMNKKRLTTWLDVREMLKDIVSGDYEPKVYPHKRAAYSVWRETVPLDRTCGDALIPMEFCLCLKKQFIPVDSKLARIVSTAIVTRLNQALAKLKNVCHDLFLKEIYSVSIVWLPGESDSRNRVVATLSVDPSNGLFQAQLYLQNSTNLDKSGINDWILEGDISRLNAYGNQSSCINDRVLRKYCYCRDILQT